MGYPTYRYHAELAPKGKVFDSDFLPAPDTGWHDSPKKFNQMQVTPGGKDHGEPSGEFPDPVAFADIGAYIGIVNSDIPVVPPPQDAAALGFTAETLEKLESEVTAKRLRALRHYAKRVHGTNLPDDVSVAAAVTACRELDAAAAKAAKAAGGKKGSGQ